MLFNVEFWYEQKYLPTKRHRKLKSRYVKDVTRVNVREFTDEEFPIAFVVHDYGHINERGEYGEFGVYATEIRTFNGELYKTIHESYVVCGGRNWLPLTMVPILLHHYVPYWKGGEDFTDKSIINADSKDRQVEYIKERADKYIIFDNKVWETCEEPMYNITTFGLGHNHGGTGMFIDYYYNSNLSAKSYFNALERDKAVAYGKEVAARRGDTKSVDEMGENKNIEVLMPEMVKRNPMKDHGDGDPFMESVESMIDSTDSVIEAGILAMLMAVR